MPNCSVVTCNNRSQTKNYKNNGVTYHIFPKNPTIKEKWIDATGRGPNWFPVQKSVICSDHFQEKCFQPLNKSRRLFEWAIPTLKICHIVSSDCSKPMPTLRQFPESNTDNLPRKNITPDFTCVTCGHKVSPTNANKDDQTATHITASTSSYSGVEILAAVPKRSCSPENKTKLPDESNDIFETPRKFKMQQKIEKCENMLNKQKAKIKSLQKKSSRYQKRISKLEDILKELNEKNFVNAEQSAHLEDLGVNDLIQRFSQTQKSGQNVATKYSPALRAFACTLHFYSPKAYEYVRKKFHTCLPHSRTIKKWYQTVNAEPGFTHESFKALKEKSEDSEYKLLCNLVMDEMAIRQRVEWDGKKMHGYVDMCNAKKSGDYLPEAKEVLVFLVTAINAPWKIPVGYFFVAGVTAEQRASLVLQCLELLEETGIQITSLTFDGCPANMSMAKHLGCSFDTNNLKTGFEHPVTHKLVYIMPDPCHMLKLLRNAFEAYGTFLDSSGRVLMWSHIRNLNDIQEKENLHLANKLRRGHIFFKNQKMKVRLASQLFSNSVADALKFCAHRNIITDGRGLDGTIDFIRNINNLFDCLNSRNMAQYDFKKPLYSGNKEKVFEFFDQMEAYITSLKLDNDEKTQVVKSDRKTGFIGFLICIKSMKALYNEHVENEKQLRYIPAYKLSQDHLELMFGNIRAHGGCNTNPTARQFLAIYKKLTVKAELRDVDTGNCKSLEKIDILTCSSASKQINMSIEARYLNDNSEEDDISQIYEQAVFDEEVNVLVKDITEFGSQAVSYIAGFVVHALLKALKCQTCVGALIANTIEDAHHGFITIKDKGGLMYPSHDVITICMRMEVVIKSALLSDKKKLNVTTKNIKEQLISKALPHFIGLDLFKDIQFHQFDQSPLTNHLILLTKAVMEKYLNIRLHYLTKNAAPKLSKRQVLNKYLHFTGQ